MSYDSETARRYRLHAASLRLIAIKFDDDESIKMIIGVARDYERMAEVFDGMDFKNVVHLRA